ncbi:MAG: hypothetical protein R3A51_06935 [Nannocystaceae bacterium]|nr:hypothetical protein [Myxococcales bacterium]
MKASARSILAAAGLAALMTSSSCGEEELGDMHGFVCIDMDAAANTDTSVFASTTNVRVKLSYSQCLQDFYLNDHPEYRLDGAMGEAIFKDWAANKLCGAGASKPLPCELDPDNLSSVFEQRLITDDNNSEYALLINYKLTEQGAVDGKRILFGPIPLEELAGCGTDVKVAANADVQGIDGNGTPIWQMVSFGPNSARSRETEGGCIAVKIGM